jgi:hypothetical protein
MATQEFMVPKSIPTILPILPHPIFAVVSEKSLLADLRAGFSFDQFGEISMVRTFSNSDALLETVTKSRSDSFFVQEIHFLMFFEQWCADPH